MKSTVTLIGLLVGGLVTLKLAIAILSVIESLHLGGGFELVGLFFVVKFAFANLTAEKRQANIQKVEEVKKEVIGDNEIVEEVVKVYVQAKALVLSLFEDKELKALKEDLAQLDEKGGTPVTKVRTRKGKS